MSENIKSVEAADSVLVEVMSTSGAAPTAPAVLSETATAPTGASAATVVRRRPRKAGADEQRGGDEEDAVAGEEVVEGAEEQVPPAAPVVQAAANGAVANGAVVAGGQAAAASSLGGVLSGVALAANPILIAGAVASVVGVAAVASGGGGDSAPPANRAPTAGADTSAATEDAPSVTGSISTNDADPDGDSLTFALTTPVAGLAVAANGTWTFDASNAAYQDLAVGETRVVTATYSVSDGRGGTSTSTLTITVTGANDGPTAAVDAAAAVEDGAVVQGSVAVNDADVDGDALSYSLTAPVDGLTFHADGSYQFDPSHPAYQALGEGEVLDVVVQYRVDDGHGGTADATLTIRVTGVADSPPNHAPVAQTDSYTTTEDGAVLSGSVAGNDSDPDGDALSYRLLTQDTPGLTFNADGSFTFDPSHPAYQSIPEFETREVRVAYEVSDGRGGVATAHLVIQVQGVNDVPAVSPMDIVSTEDDAIVRGTIAASDPEGGPLAYVLPDPAPAGLTFGADGSYAFDPSNAAYQGLAEGEVLTIVATYRVVDASGAGAAAALTITLTGTNDAPVAVVDAAAATEDGAVVSGSVATNDSDVDGDALSYVLNQPVAGLTLNADGTYSFDASDPAYQDLNQGQTRDVTATYTVRDGRGGTSTATLTITVSGQDERPNTPPDVADDVAAVSEGDAPFTGSVAANDDDADGDTLSYRVVTGAPGLTLNQDGSYSFDARDPEYDALAEGEVRVVTATYLVLDGRGGSVLSTLTITVTGTNDVPVATAAASEGPEDQGVLAGTVAGSRDDADDGAVLNYTTGTAPNGFAMSAAGGYTLDLTHADYQGLSAGDILVLTIPYTVTDEHGASSTAVLTLTVHGRNDAPIAVASTSSATEDGSPVTGRVSASDADHDARLTYTLDRPVAGLTLNGDGTYSFDPRVSAYQDLGEGEFRDVVAAFTVEDEHGITSTSTLTIRVTGVNDAPTAAADSLEVGEDAGQVSGSVATNDTDADGNRTLTYSLVGSLPGLTMNADGSYTFDTRHSVYQSIPRGRTEYIGVTYEVRDEHNAVSRSTLTLIVEGANDAPQAEAATASATEDGFAVTGSLVGEVSDPDVGRVLKFALVDPVAGVTLNEDGSYSFDPTHASYQYLSENQTLDVPVRYTVTDEHGASVESVLTVTVTGRDERPNTLPVAEDEAANAVEDHVLTGSVADNDSDADGDVLKYRKISEYPGLTMDENGGYRFDAGHAAYRHLKAGDTTEIIVHYEVSDGFGGFAEATLTITLTGTNDVPTAVADTLERFEGTAAITGTVAANDGDVDDDRILTFSVAPADLPAGLIFNANGSYTFDAQDAAYNALYHGEIRTIRVPYTVTDEHGASATSTLTITLTGTNDAPVATVEVAAVDEDAALLTGSVADNVTDVDARAPLTFEVKDGAPLPPGLTFDAQGGYTFNPAHPAYQDLGPGEVRIVQITYVARDEIGHGESTLTITVTGTNDTPTATAETLSVNEDDAIINDSVTDRVTDADTTAVLTYAVVGTLPAGVTFDRGTYSFDPGHDSYQHLARGQQETVEFTYSVTDEHGAQAQATVRIIVTGTNDRPTASDGLVVPRFEDDASFTSQLPGADVDDSHVLTFTPRSFIAGFSMNDRGVYTFDPADSAYQYLEVGQELDVTIPYTVTDEFGASRDTTIIIRITGRNDAPVVVADTAQTSEDAAGISGSVAENDRDPDARDSLTFAVVAPAPAGFELDADGAWRFNPADPAYQHIALGATENVVVTYTATDEHGVSRTSTLTITVAGVNDAPTTTDKAASVGEDAVALNGTVATSLDDVDDDRVLTYVATSTTLPAGLTFNSDGSYSLDLTLPEYQRLPAGQTLALAVPYTVTDQHGAQAGATLTITVIGANDAPQAHAATAVASENGGSIGGDLRLPGTDIDTGALLRFVVDGTAPAGFSLNTNGQYSFNANDPAYDYLRAGDSVDLVINYIVRDEHNAESRATLTIRVTGTNDLPRAQGEGRSATEDGALVTGSVKDNDSDPDQNTTLIYEWNTIPPGFVVFPDGRYEFNPADPAYQHLKEGEIFAVVARYTVRDADGGTATAQLQILLTGANDAPVGVADHFIVGEGMPLSVPTGSGLLVNDRDPDGNPMTMELVTGPANGTLVLDANGTGGFTYTPNPGYTGQDTFTYIPKDGSSSGTPVTVTINVTAITEDGVSFATVGTEFGHIGGESVVNANKSGNQSDARVAAFADGSYVVTWSDVTGDGSSDCIKAQRYTASGQKLGSEFVVNSVTLGPQLDPTVAVLTGGGFVIQWVDSQTTSGEIRAQRYDASGQRVGTEFTVNTVGSNAQNTGSIAALTNGGFVITWTDASGANENNQGVRAQIYDANGAKVGGEVLVNTAQLGDQRDGEVIATPDGGFVVAWRDTNVNQVKLQRFDSTGAKLGAEVVAGAGGVKEVDVAVLADGRMVVVWQQNLSAGNHVVWRVFDAAGQPEGPATRVNDVGSALQGVGSVTVLSDGGFVIVWAEGAGSRGDGSGSAIMAQRFDASGARIGSPFVCNLVAIGDQTLPAVAALPNGGFALTWTDGSRIGEDQSGSSVKIQIFGDRPPFSAVEQEALDLKGKITVEEDGGAAEISVVISVQNGVLEVVAGSSGATVTGSGTSSVRITGTPAQISALLGSDPTSIARFVTSSDTPPQGILLSVTVYDGDTVIAEGTQIITIREVNDKPILGADTALTAKEDDALVTGTLAGNDSDADGDPLVYTLTNNIAGFVLNSDGSYTFDAAHPNYRNLVEGQVTTLTIQYSVADGRGQVATGTFNILLTGTNDRPVANAITAAVTEGSVITGFASGSDPDSGDTVTYAVSGDDLVPAGFRFTTGTRYEFDARDPAYAHLGVGQTMQVTVWYVAIDRLGARSDKAALTITVTGTAAGATALVEDGSEQARLHEAEASMAYDPAADELVPVFETESFQIERAEAGRRFMDISDFMIEDYGDPLETLLAGLGTSSTGETLVEGGGESFVVPDGFVPLEPLDPLLIAHYAVVV